MPRKNRSKLRGQFSDIIILTFQIFSSVGKVDKKELFFSKDELDEISFQLLQAVIAKKQEIVTVSCSLCVW